MLMRIAPRLPEDWNKPPADFPLARPKVIAIGFLALIGLLVIAVGLRMIPAEPAGMREAAHQVRACKDYLHGDPKLLKVLCNPNNWRQGDAVDGNQASLP